MGHMYRPDEGAPAQVALDHAPSYIKDLIKTLERVAKTEATPAPIEGCRFNPDAEEFLSSESASSSVDIDLDSLSFVLGPEDINTGTSVSVPSATIVAAYEQETQLAKQDSITTEQETQPAEHDSITTDQVMKKLVRFVETINRLPNLEVTHEDGRPNAIMLKIANSKYPMRSRAANPPPRSGCYVVSICSCSYVVAKDCLRLYCVSLG